jgi:uncharacterized protein
MPTSPLTEEAHIFGPASLVGVLSLPDAPPRTTVIVIVGGPQYRVGSHRQFVLLCRALAAQGHAAFRFDYTGMGDAPGELGSFLSASGDIAQAVNLVQTKLPNVQRIVLWGLCDGASAALLYLHETRDIRIHGLCLVNPWVRSPASHAQTQVKHYYAQRLMQWAFWRKLLSGQIAASALLELARTLKTFLLPATPQAHKKPSFQDRMATAWSAFPGRILLVTSGQDYTAKEFLETAGREPAWQAAMRHPRLQAQEIVSADHTFSSSSNRLELEALTSAWVAQV